MYVKVNLLAFSICSLKETERDIFNVDLEKSSAHMYSYTTLEDLKWAKNWYDTCHNHIKVISVEKVFKF